MSKTVVGLNFGDEAKGLTTSWLCSLTGNPLVVRFNGGHQAGHTVVYKGKRHVFSSFGSGTLQGVPTYWSKHCTFSPAAFLRERELLDNPKILVNPDCPVTTPFDIEANRAQNNGHGTVGVGFGTTLAREEAFYKLRVRDLFYPDVLSTKLYLLVENYYKTDITGGVYVDTLLPFLKQCAEAIKYVTLYDDNILSGYNLVFEGAQGILLDQDHGFFPHVTRSNTTSKNAIGLSPEHNEIYYVTRSYLTRHGAGPFPAGGRVSLKNTENETNRDGEYQGKFRTGLLNPQLTNFALKVDDQFHNARKHLVITCMDQYELDVPRFLSQIKGWFQTVSLSYGPSLDYLEEYKQRTIYSMY